MILQTAFDSTCLFLSQGVPYTLYTLYYLPEFCHKAFSTKFDTSCDVF